MVEFAYNNTHQPIIKTTPFLACYGFHPKFSEIIDLLYKFANRRLITWNKSFKK